VTSARSLTAICWLLITSGSLCGQPAPKANVVVITLDTVRADRLGCYGYKGAETPHIDALARAGARFTHAYTPVPITLPAHASLLTGAFPTATGIHDFSGNTLAPDAVTLAKVLRNNGYATAAFIASAVLDARFGLNQGFDTYSDHFEFSRLDEASLDRMERPANLVIDEAIDWLKHSPRRPFFLWVHLYDPHHPYAPPEPYAGRYRARPYDGEIAFADAQLGRLVASIESQGTLENALIVLAGDHGESLGEHGEETHGFFLYNSTLHVPLIVKVPGAAPRVVENEVSLVDVMPTVLQALRLPIPPTVQGRSLLSSVLGRSAAGSSSLLAENYLPLLHFGWSPLKALQSAGMKYIDAPQPELYDTRRDPGETKNLFQARQAAAHEMRDRLLSMERRYTPAQGGGRGDRVPTDPALEDRLRSLGYVAVSAGGIVDAKGRTLIDPKERVHVYELIFAANFDSQSGRYAESLHKLTQAEKVEPELITIRYLMALNYYRLRDYRHAMERFQSVLHLDPQYSLATYYLGVCQLETGSLDAAVASFRQTLRLDPSNFVAAYNLGVAYTRQKRPDDAIAAFLQATKILPQYAEAHAALGELYLYLKRVDEAIDELEKAVALNPTLRRARQHLGQAYAAKGLDEKARKEFELAK
jgi:arylsulfatase A-like enzyme/Flp pilus assembly protein TadD